MSVDLPHLHNVLRDRTRAKILELLNQSGPLAYIELQSLLGVTHTGKLNYHLKLLGDMIAKDGQSGKYGLTEKGRLALTLLGKFRAVATEAYASERRRLWATRGAITVAVISIVLSVFFVVVGVPYTVASINESCSIAAQCTQSTPVVTNEFLPTMWALIPLAAGGTVVFGVLNRKKLVSWTGTLALAVFSFISLFSIGLLYMLLVPFLVGLLAALPPVSKNQT